MLKWYVIKKNAIFNGFCNAGQLLIDDASSSNIQVADFRIAHLTFWKTNSKSAGLKTDAGIFCEEQIQVGCICGCDRVSVIGGIQTETVQDHQHCRSFSCHDVYLLSLCDL